MQTYLAESAVAMEGGTLLVTKDTRDARDPPIRDTRWSYAKFVRDDGHIVDLMSAFSLALLPDPNKASEAKRTAKSQLDVAASTEGPVSRTRYEAAARKYEWESDQYLRFSREMPGFVAALTGAHAIAAFRNGHRTAVVRVIDVRESAVVAEFTGDEIDRLFGPPSTYRRSPEERDVLDELRGQLGDLAAHIPPNEGVLPSRTKLIAAADGLVIASLGTKGTVVLSFDGSRLVPVCNLGLFAESWGCAAICGGHVLVNGSPRMGPDQAIHLIEVAQDRVVGRWPDRHTGMTNAVAAPAAGIIWLAGFGNSLGRVDIASRTLVSQPAWSGFSKDDLLRVSSTTDGHRLLLRCTEHDRDVVVMLDAANGAITRFAIPSRESVAVGPEEYPNLVRVPGVAIVGGAPVLIRAGAMEPLAPISPRAAIRRTVVTVPPRLRQSVLGKVDEDTLQDLARVYSPGLCMTAERSNASAGLGATRFGGLPDLLEGGSWPHFDREPMYFLAQFNLEEIARHSEDSRLPRRGLLSFFRAHDPEYGDPMWWDPEERLGTSVVLYAPALDDLSPAPRPLRLRAVLPECRIKFGRARSLPPLDSWRWNVTSLAEEQRGVVEQLDECAEIHREPSELGLHQLCGYFDYDQDARAFNAEKMTRGMAARGGIDRDTEEGSEILRACADWVPLARFETCSAAGWQWADGGSLIFMIKDADLAACRFDRAVAVSQR